MDQLRITGYVFHLTMIAIGTSIRSLKNLKEVMASRGEQCDAQE